MAMNKGVIVEGETDGKLHDQYYMKVNGELYHYTCILIDTSEARCALDLIVKANKATQEAVTLTSMTGIRYLGQYMLKH